MKNVTGDEDTLDEEIVNYEPGIKQYKVEKLTKVVQSMELEIYLKNSIKIPAIDLIMRPWMKIIYSWKTVVSTSLTY